MLERPGADPVRIAGAARAAFIDHIDPLFEVLAGAIEAHLNGLADKVAPVTVMHRRRDDAVRFAQARGAWVATARRDWATPSPKAGASAFDPAVELSLMDDDAVENRIQASRLALVIEDAASGPLRELRLRMRTLEPGPDPDGADVLGPERLTGLLLDGWTRAGLSRPLWIEIVPIVRPLLIEAISKAYLDMNQRLERSGVDARPEMRSASRRVSAPPSVNVPRMASSALSSVAADAPSARSTPSTVSARDSTPRSVGADGPAAAGPIGAVVPPGRGLLGQLRAFVAGRGPSAVADTWRAGLSPRLERVIQDSPPVSAMLLPGQAVGDPDVRQMSVDLRDRLSALKGQAEHASERALIEIVALMFQSILAEDRIPASIRVWFARLQMPVLRVALSEPEFFETLAHPACRLIDRMGSCVMGFEPQSIQGGALEAEIRRIVQTIEQYPDTASEAFGVLLGEFELFLKSFLTHKDEMRQLVSVAQQVELMETQVVRYTIEMRQRLEAVPVPEVVREFLFKVWVEVLAMADVKLGPSDPQTASLRQVATDLLSAASPKPRRQERARVIQDLPDLLQRLRQGMALRGMDARAQDAHIQRISATLADAFMSRTRVIPPEDIRELSRRLTLIETVAAEDARGTLVFDTRGLRRLIGDSGRPIEILLDVEGTPAGGATTDLGQLHPGDWLVLDHNGQVVQVQYLWHSQHGHLHLLASAAGACFLFQAGRLAAYLSSRLLAPADSETLTFRAARQALAKIEANPERL
jgi:Protein of unknown function (DUF1631)